MWHTLTNFGDSAVMIPAALAIGLWLALRRTWSQFLAWWLLLGAGSLLVLSSKLAFIGWGIGIPAIRFTGFSGHAFMSASILPVLGYLLLERYKSGLGRSGVLFGIGAALAVAVSRVVVGAHSPSEVISGCALGLWVSILFLRMQGKSGRPQQTSLIIAVCLLVAAGALFGLRAPSQDFITQLALYLSGRAPASW